MRSRWRSCFPSIIPAMASLMYILSLTHWTVSLRFFTLRTIMINDYLEFPLPLYALDVVILTLLSLNVVMSDAVVLWRMCVVWERARPAVALATVLMITTIGVNIANIVLSTRTQLSEFGSGRLYVPPGENKKDTEDILIYGLDSVGVAAAFVSLASNSCATILVGTKAFLHRRLLSKYLRCGTGRTLAQRVMELLAESGVIYTAIWLLYCVSFLRPFATYDIFAFRNLGLSPLLLIYVVTAVSHLDAAMAQITSIYPLMVFSLVALDKLHHSRGPWTLHHDVYQPEEGNQAVTVTFEIDVERSSAQPSTPARPMIALRSEGDGDQYAMDETKARATAV
ncbi:hypothetical protein PENSPDRAFT_644281 [Peniophora sp. CONT]|nr:hypothetical protein PENSPDRAFT_644281 [Peniophora sp. CONT]